MREMHLKLHPDHVAIDYGKSLSLGDVQRDFFLNCFYQVCGKCSEKEVKILHILTLGKLHNQRWYYPHLYITRHERWWMDEGIKLYFNLKSFHFLIELRNFCW